MKTLNEFIEEACQEFNKFECFEQSRLYDGAEQWLKEKLLQSATLTAEAVKGWKGLKKTWFDEK